MRSSDGAEAELTGNFRGPLAFGVATTTLEKFAGFTRTKTGRTTTHRVGVKGSNLTLHGLLEFVNHPVMCNAGGHEQLGSASRTAHGGASCPTRARPLALPSSLPACPAFFALGSSCATVAVVPAPYPHVTSEMRSPPTLPCRPLDAAEAGARRP